MKITVTESDFRDAFRSVRPDSFSYYALGELFEFFTQLEDDIGEEIELDPIAICCDWAEYTLDELSSEYGYMTDEDTSEWDLDDWVRLLSEHTPVIKCDHVNALTPDMGTNSLLVEAF